MKRSQQILCLLAVLLAVFLLPGYSFAQDNGDTENMIEVLRADMRANKVAIVTKAMAFKPGEAEKFWPVYQSYEAEVITLNNARLKLMKEYAQKYDTLSDAEAKTMAEKFFDWQTQRTNLQRKYFKKMASATSYLIATKFFQLEHRLNLIVDLGVVSELPSLFLESAAGPDQ